MGLYTKKTNNDLVGFNIKVKQRVSQLKGRPKVLDAFAGEGLIWNQVIKNFPGIEITSLEKKKALNEKKHCLQ